MKKLLLIFLSALIFCGCAEALPAEIDEGSTPPGCILKKDTTLFTIIDRSKDNPDLAFAMALEPIYEDEENIYSFSCIKSSFVVVEYADGTEENIKSALSSGKVEISDLDRFGIGYITEPKEHIHKESDGDNVVEHEFFGYCGNTMTTVKYLGMGKDKQEWEYSFWGGVSVGLTDFLRWFDYSEEVCKCLPEYIVTTEFGIDYGINLAEGYVRHNGKQVSLTKEQKDTLEEMLDKVYDGYINDKIPGSNL